MQENNEEQTAAKSSLNVGIKKSSTTKVHLRVNARRATITKVASIPLSTVYIQRLNFLFKTIYQME